MLPRISLFQKSVILALISFSFSLAVWGQNAKSAGDDQAVKSLFKAIQDDSIQALQRAIDAGASPNSTLGYGTALGSAVNWGNIDIIKYLLDHGADVNLRDGEGSTPLNNGSGPVKNEVEIVRLLIKAGADVNSKNKAGETPLQAFSGRGSEGAVALLLIAHADIDKQGGQALLNAIEYDRSTRLVTMLLEAGANPNFEGYYGSQTYTYTIVVGTPLMSLASRWGGVSRLISKVF